MRLETVGLLKKRDRDWSWSSAALGGAPNRTKVVLQSSALPAVGTGGNKMKADRVKIA